MSLFDKSCDSGKVTKTLNIYKGRFLVNNYSTMWANRFGQGDSY